MFRAIASRDDREVARRLDVSRDLAILPIHVGASRDCAKTYFLTAIHHYVYSGDTALHISAAADQRQLAESLVTRGADVRARNRRGAEPLHYAADGGPGANGWDPVAQRDVVTYLIEAGADPNVLDKSGVPPLHRVVRNRCSMAVERPHRQWCGSAADEQDRFDAAAPRGSEHRQEQFRLGGGKRRTGPDHRLAPRTRRESDHADVNGKTVAAAATSDWIRDLLGTH